MEPILNVVLPVFAIIAVGYAAGRTGFMGSQSVDILNTFVFFFALPALFFGTMSQIALDEVLNWRFIAVWSGGALATLGLAMAVGAFAFPNRSGALSLLGLCAMFSNAVYMGIPILQLAFGPEGLLPAIVVTVLTGTGFLSVGIVMLELDRDDGGGPVAVTISAAKGVLRSPLVLSAGSGLLVSWGGIEVPEPFLNFCTILGSAAGPTALFAMGLFMVGKPLRAGLLEVGWITVLKLAFMPALTYWLAYHVIPLEPLWAQSAVILAALPTGGLMFILSQRYGIYVQRATASIMITTAISVVTLSALLVLMGLA